MPSILHPPSSPEFLVQKFRSGFAAPFRGEIWEDDAEVPMAKGYSNEGRPFDIGTACYLRPVMRSIRNPSVRQVTAMAAVQTLKTYGTIERPAAFFIKHDPGDMTIYDCDIDAASDHAKSRLGPLLKSMPGISMQVEETLAQSRFDVTTTEFYLPGMTLRIWPLNESATQRITLRYVFISDGFLSKRTGLIGQAKARSTQHPNDRKIIIESQGGEEGDDFDVEWKLTNQGELHVVCPFCGQGQPFEFHRTRADDFRARPPKSVPSLDVAAWVEHWSALLSKPDRMNTGFKRGDEELIRLEDGNYNEQEILRQTYYECYHCGSAWRDTPEIRRQLDESAYYVPKNPNALPENVGFNWPAWINQRIAWGGEHVMLGYLRAKDVERRFGNKEQLMQWYQKRAARPWNQAMGVVTAPVIRGSARIEGAIPDELCRVGMADAQQDDALTAATGQPTTGHFWAVARAIDKSGNMFQLDRAYLTSWDELIEFQNKNKISNENFGIDCAFYRSDIIDMAARKILPYTRRVKRHGRWRDETIWHTWTMLVGSDRGSWKHPDGVYRSVSIMQPQVRQVTLKGQSVQIKVPLYEWSNLNIKDMLNTLRAGGEGKPKFERLVSSALRESTRLKETNDFTYDNQMSAEFKTLKKNGKPFWDKSRRHNHYWDCECGCLVLFGLGGFLGVAAAPETPANMGD